MRNGWIKLHVKTLDNELWQHDPLAWRVFEYLLLRAYHGKPQGTVATTRYQIAEATSSNNNAVYSALKRLEKAKMTTATATNKYTLIRISKWHNYQGNSNNASNITATTKQQQNNTLIRIKNKELNTTKVVFGKPEINELFNYWLSKTGIAITSQVKANRYAASSLLKRHGEDTLHRFINGVVLAQADKYAPRISNFVQLQAKLPDLLVWGKQQSKSKGVKIS